MADVLDTVPELASIDREVARGLARMAGETEGAILMATALASRATRQGHVCVDGAWLSAALTGATGDSWPAAAGWPAVLERSKLVGGPGDATPLVFDAGALYLRRYFAHETRLADSLRARIGHLDEGLDGALLRDGLDRLFPPTGERDLQRLAALVAVTRRFSIISGGPGTGKTTTVVKILALLAEQARGAGRPRLHILVVAPTGKAAARLGEILRERRDLAVEAEVRDMIPEEASTIHRALQPLPGSRTRFRHDRSNPLAADVVLVDEASMVDLALMSRLVDAVPPRARLILLGDRNQLASVEAGAILGDLCGPPDDACFSKAFVRHVAELVGENLPTRADAPEESTIADCVVRLRRNWRYPAGSGIARLSNAINDGNADEVTQMLRSGAYPDATQHPAIARGDLGAALRARVLEGYRPYLREKDGASCFAAFGRFRVLCAHRRGAWGVEQLNPSIAEALEEAGLLRPTGDWYARRPVLVTENDYQANLSNGDIGIVLADAEEGGAARVWFLKPDGEPRKLAPSRLPHCETVFAMTVHKAQGSEFEAVAVVLPPKPSPVLTRELLYTAVTRPRRQVAIFGDAEVIAYAVKRPIDRASRLRERLWPGPG